MNSVLHITNGDAFSNRFKKMKWKGDVITWREMLCEGKTTADIGSESFWRFRFDFLNKYYKVSKKQFIEKTLKEYRNLCNQKQQEQIVLWFEYDLFCQINLIAVLTWLKNHRKGASIQLVCSGNQFGESYLGLNQLNDQQLTELYNNRIELDADDLYFAEYVWQLYCSDNPIRLESISKFNSSQLPFITDAIAAHLKRFPSLRNGLNQIEQAAIELAAQKTYKNEKVLVGDLLKNDHPYGFGDSQYFKMLHQIKPLFTNLNPVKLSRKGKKALDNSLNVYRYLQNNEFLGGAPKYGFIYNHHQEKLLKL
ncbi:MAG: DUF1835 domain-containing protein [Flavobacteriaceae bacterium]|nr:DUF1835 domain-containing protein [Flavobacteriaceae bacterium]